MSKNQHEAHNIPVDDMANTQNPEYLIVSARTAAGVMMSVALRGYTIWLINIVLCIYFFTQTFKISDYNRIKAAILNPIFVSPDGTMRKMMPHQNSPYADKLVRLMFSIFVYTFF